MALTKSDKKYIKETVADIVYKVVNANNELIYSRFDKLQEEMNRRFDENDREHKEIKERLDRLFRIENEDITAVYTDIDKMKIRLKKAGV